MTPAMRFIVPKRCPLPAQGRRKIHATLSHTTSFHLVTERIVPPGGLHPPCFISVKIRGVLPLPCSATPVTVLCMLDAQLLALLVCPATHQDVALATPAELERLIQAIRDGDVRTVAGKEADAALDGALVRQDGAVAYAIRDGIPVMLVDEGLAIGHLDLRREEALRV